MIATPQALLLALLLGIGMPAAAAPPAEQPPTLRLTAGEFRPLEEAPSGLRAELTAAAPSGRTYRIVITRVPLAPAERKRLEAAGAEILGYLPVNGYRVRIAPGAERELESLPFVAWAGALPGRFKIEPELARGTESAAGTVRLRVILTAGESADRALVPLADLETLARPSGKDGAWRVTAEVPAAKLVDVLARLGDLPEVEWVETAREMRLLNQDGVWVHQSNVGPSPQQTPVFDRGIYGCGQIVALADTGQDYDLCYFRDTVNGPPPVSSCLVAPCPSGTPQTNRRKDILYYNWSGTPTGDDDACPPILGGSGHGTHTSGSIAGDQPPYADCGTFTTPGRSGGDGMAPGAKLIVQEMGDGVEYLNERGGTVWNLSDVAHASGARIHSNSWGGSCRDVFGQCIPGCTLPYDSFARDADLAMWTYPDLLIVYSVGNARQFCPPPRAVGTPAIAKSPLAVGSVGHGSAAGVPSDFSSPGPTEDGRLRPALAAQGESTVSAASDANPASNNCGSCSLDGTSMSAPTTAGLAALVREYYTAGFYAAGTRAPAQGFVPQAALVKATLIDGGVALGPDAPEPDFVSGFGRIQLDRTLAFAGSPFALRVHDERVGLVTGGVASHAYDVAAGTPFRATLVWSDYPAELNAAVTRVNELKLEVIDPSGTVWFQTLDPATSLPRRTSDPLDPHDARNVEERLVFDAPAAGRWVVRVRGLSVPMGPQPFALVVRGALTDCPAVAAPQAPTLATPADHQVLVSWPSVPGAQSYDVFRSLGACPSGAPVAVALAHSATSFLDTTVSGGVTYAYTVVAASDAAGACESPPSPCAEVVPSGDCFLAPLFGGVGSAASTGAASCGVALEWDAAAPRCGAEARYNVYRETSPTFTPGPTNRVARCLLGTSWTDTANLAAGATYHYVVRAEDAAAGHGGPCLDGNEDTNSARAAAAPSGPPGDGTWTDDAGDSGIAKFTLSGWTTAATGGNAGPKVYTVASSAGACADLTSPTLTLSAPGTGPQLSFSTRHNLEFDPFGIFGAEGSVGQVEIATGPTFSNWTRVPLTPDYPRFVEFTLINCTSTGDGFTFFADTFMTYRSYTASLTNWGGGDVKLRFHLSGDFLYPGGNWWIDDVAVSHTLVPGTCATTDAGPPPVPDGGPVPGAPLRVGKSGTNLVLTWDATRCPAQAVNVYRGTIGNYTTFGAGTCGLPPTGTATLTLPDNTWFLLAATDGAATDGSWARAPDGAERVYAGAATACGVSQHVTTNGCP